MRISIILFIFLCQHKIVSCQNNTTVLGFVYDKHTKNALSSAVINLEATQISTSAISDGSFKIISTLQGEYILKISAKDHVTQRIPIILNGKLIDLGVIYLEFDITLEQNDNLISLTDAELFDDDLSANATGLLQATRDVFLNRAAFDFGQAFFSVRGYDSKDGKVLINGIPMNKFFDGRPQWNNWGGLNDVTRNQEFTNGLQASAYNFGAILGTTNINTRPTGMRPGFRLSSSASNRTYGGRIMATYTAPLNSKGLAYTVSGSRRWAEEGYIDGTLYDAFSFFGALEFKMNEKNSFLFTGILASNRRGRSSAVTEEVYELIGNRYNPHWGEQDGKIRNSRERKIAEPLFVFNHFYQSENVKLTTGVSYQTGINSRSRLGFYNAPNPDPTFYRYLPSFYVNSPIGANFISANMAKKGFLDNPQLNWNQVYRANEGQKAAYVLYDDISKENQLTANSNANINLNNALRLDMGVNFQKMNSDNYAQINDLLGATFHEDIDAFSNTLNDTSGNIQKNEGDIFNYNYQLFAEKFEAFSQLNYDKKALSTFLAANYTNINYQRKGLYQNERFINNSLGASEKLVFSNFGIKGGATYKLNGRHWLGLNAALLNEAPVLQNAFINPRENNQSVSELQSEKISTADASYFLRLPNLTGRITGFYTRFQNTTDVNFFFVDAGVGSDFVQEVLTDLDKLHLGTEIGFEYQVSSTVQLTAVAAINKLVYASNPNVSINFDTAGAEEDLINLEGRIDLGQAAIKDYKLAQGPQQAFALGINYRDPKYWWVGLTANYLGNNYANISTITRTQSFYLDPETGLNFPDATPENVNALLAQKPLDNFYLLNLIGGKSWLKTGKYISVFASVNNVFDTIFRTGGFEQSRNGNFGQLKKDNLSGNPSFAPRYWYGFGRTFFLNVAISF